MLAPLSWLKDFVDIDCSVEELEKRLFDSDEHIFVDSAEAFDLVGPDTLVVLVE